MRKSLTALLLLGLLPLPASANLGETVKECVARYGSPMHYSEANTRLPFGTVTFLAGGYELILFILNDKEVGARVSKMDKSPLSEKERETILNSDPGSSGWTRTKSSDPTCVAWSRSDKATALYDEQARMLIFTSVEMAQALHPVAAKTAPGN